MKSTTYFTLPTNICGNSLTGIITLNCSSHHLPGKCAKRFLRNRLWYSATNCNRHHSHGVLQEGGEMPFCLTWVPSCPGGDVYVLDSYWRKKSSLPYTSGRLVETRALPSQCLAPGKHSLCNSQHKGCPITECRVSALLCRRVKANCDPN